jgi:hypothetical protein
MKSDYEYFKKIFDDSDIYFEIEEELIEEINIIEIDDLLGLILDYIDNPIILRIIINSISVNNLLMHNVIFKNFILAQKNKLKAESKGILQELNQKLNDINTLKNKFSRAP